MCQFFSALVVRNGDVLWHEATDSHTDLVRHYQLPDNTDCRHFAKVEFTPPAKNGRPDYLDVGNYTLRVDEYTEPAWFEEYREAVTAKCRHIVQSMIITDARDLILGGKWILAGDAKINDFRARAVICQDSASIDSVRDTARIGSVRDTARIDSVGDTARIDSVGGSASIGSVGDTASIDSVRGSARIDSVRDSAHIGKDLRPTPPEK